MAQLTVASSWRRTRHRQRPQRRPQSSAIEVLLAISPSPRPALKAMPPSTRRNVRLACTKLRFVWPASVSGLGRGRPQAPREWLRSQPWPNGSGGRLRRRLQSRRPWRSCSRSCRSGFAEFAGFAVAKFRRIKVVGPEWDCSFGGGLRKRAALVHEIGMDWYGATLSTAVDLTRACSRRSRLSRRLLAQAPRQPSSLLKHVVRSVDR